MISAIEALKLPTAKLNEDELAAANMLEAEIEAHINKYMERRGVDFETREIRPNVVSEINQRLKVAGYNPVWMKMSRQSKITGQSEPFGYQIQIAPSDASYETDRAAPRLLSA